MRIKLLFLLLIVGTVNAFAQNVGDYRSAGVGPATWNNAASWQYYNGTTWVNAATPINYGYPGQVAGNYNVEIQANHIIQDPFDSLPFENINGPKPFGTLTINGTLSISNNQNVYLSASSVIVTNLLGQILFVQNGDLRLLANAILTVFPPSGTYLGGIPQTGNCSSSKRIWFGSVLFSNCSGAGSPISFQELTGGGGTINANITINPYQCFDSIVTLTGSSSGSNSSGSITVIKTFTWTVTAPGQGPVLQVPNPGETINIPLNLDGIYTIDLTYVANYYTNINQAPVYTISNTETVKITSAVSTWNGSWTPSAPNSSRRAIIASGNYNTATHDSFSACSLVINSGASVTIAPDTYIETEYHVTNNGTLNIQNSGSLVQKDNSATFTGINNTVTRVSRPMKGRDFVYWGSPVQENVFNQIPADFDLKYKWNLTGGFEGNFVNLSANPVVNGEGFVTRVKNIAPYSQPGGGSLTFNFGGTLNSGTITIPAARVNVYGDTQDDKLLASGNTVLLGNPYPSAISANALVTHPTNEFARKMGTLYFFTSVSGFINGQYTNDDYASWNLSGGTAPPSDPTNTNLIPSGNIASGQGFFAQVFIDGEVVFNNSMRIRDNNSNTQFFRMTEGTATELERHRIWVNLSNGTDAYRQMMMGYIEGATNDFDYQYDGASFTTNEIDIYTLLDANALSIQGRALPFEATDVIPLGYRITNPGIYTITLGATDGLFAGNQEVYLKDKTTHTYHNLKKEPFQFNGQKGTFHDRFELRFIDQSRESNPIVSENNFQMYSLDQSIIINSPDANIQSIEVYDLLGKLIYSKQNIQTPTMTTSSINVANPFLIVKVILSNNQVITKKLILN